MLPDHVRGDEGRADRPLPNGQPRHHTEPPGQAPPSPHPNALGSTKHRAFVLRNKRRHDIPPSPAKPSPPAPTAHPPTTPDALPPPDAPALDPSATDRRTRAVSVARSSVLVSLRQITPDPPSHQSRANSPGGLLVRITRGRAPQPPRNAIDPPHMMSQNPAPPPV